MQKNELIKSWIFIVLFWWIAGYAILSYQTGADFIEEVKQQAKHLLDYVISNDSELNNAAETTSDNDAKGYQAKDWTLFGLSLVFLSFSFGFSLVFFTKFFVHANQFKRIKVDGSWRGITVSYGSLPVPAWMQITPEFESSNLDFSTLVETNESVKKLQSLYDSLDEKYQKVIRDVLYIIASNPDAHVGYGHELNSKETPYSLLEHTIRVLSEGWHNNDDPLLPIVLVAHDLGKIPVWEKKGFATPAHTWTKNGYHDDRGSLMVSSLRSIESLTDDEVTIISICIKYSHKPNKKPIHPRTEINERIAHILENLNQADQTTTAEEQFLVIQKTPDEIYANALEQALMNLKWNHAGSAYGTINEGWRKDDMAYTLPNALSELFLEYLTHDLRAALKTHRKTKDGLSKASLKLLDVLKKEGMLVHPEITVQTQGGLEYLWTLNFEKTRPTDKALVMKGLFGIRLPEKLRTMAETSYSFQVEPFSVGIPTTSTEMEKKIKSQSEEDKALLVAAALYGMSIEDVKKMTKSSKTKTASTTQTQAEEGYNTDNNSGNFKKKPLVRKSKKITVTLNPDEFSLTPQ